MASIERQYLTFYANLGGARAAQLEDEDLMERLLATHEKAYAAVEKNWRGIVGRVEADHEIESEVFELCEDDAQIEERDGMVVFSVCFVSHKHVPLASVKGMRECVERAYAEAAAQDGVTAQFAMAERTNVLRVTETAKVDFDVEPPAVI